MHPICKRVIGIAIDPSDPQDMYAAIEVGGLLGSRDGGASWTSITNGPYVRNNTLDLHGVQVSAAEPGVVHIVTQIAMFRGRNRGQLWETRAGRRSLSRRLLLPRSAGLHRMIPTPCTWRREPAAAVPRKARPRQACSFAAAISARPGTGLILAKPRRVAWAASPLTPPSPRVCIAVPNADRSTAARTEVRAGRRTPCPSNSPVAATSTPWFAVNRRAPGHFSHCHRAGDSRMIGTSQTNTSPKGVLSREGESSYVGAHHACRRCHHCVR